MGNSTDIGFNDFSGIWTFRQTVSFSTMPRLLNQTCLSSPPVPVSVGLLSFLPIQVSASEPTCVKYYSLNLPPEITQPGRLFLHHEQLFPAQMFEELKPSQPQLSPSLPLPKGAELQASHGAVEHIKAGSGSNMHVHWGFVCACSAAHHWALSFNANQFLLL